MLRAEPTIPDHTRSSELSRAACEVIPGGVNTSLRRMVPELTFVGAHGARISDADGNEYVDYHAAFGPIILGHNDAAVGQRVKEVMEKIDLLGVGTTELEIELARFGCDERHSAPEKIGQMDPLSAGSLPQVLCQTVVCSFNSLEEVEKAVEENQGENL